MCFQCNTGKNIERPLFTIGSALMKRLDDRCNTPFRPTRLDRFSPRAQSIPVSIAPPRAPARTGGRRPGYASVLISS